MYSNTAMTVFVERPAPQSVCVTVHRWNLRSTCQRFVHLHAATYCHPHQASKILRWELQCRVVESSSQLTMCHLTLLIKCRTLISYLSLKPWPIFVVYKWYTDLLFLDLLPMSICPWISLEIVWHFPLLTENGLKLNAGNRVYYWHIVAT